ncbi:hypothetical protein NHF40_13710 [Maricaulaceae bacterium EIL42A08]|nr:hypothetical protein [Maricaulaceae bacterium EIL42A08]
MIAVTTPQKIAESPGRGIELQQSIPDDASAPRLHLRREVLDGYPNLKRAYTELTIGAGVALVLAIPSGFASIGFGVIVGGLFWYLERYRPAMLGEQEKQFFLEISGSAEAAALLQQEMTQRRWKKPDLVTLAEEVGRRAQYAERTDYFCSEFCILLSELSGIHGYSLEQGWSAYRQWRNGYRDEDLNSSSRAERIDNMFGYIKSHTTSDGVFRPR